MNFVAFVRPSVGQQYQSKVFVCNQWACVDDHADDGRSAFNL